MRSFLRVARGSFKTGVLGALRPAPASLTPASTSLMSLSHSFSSMTMSKPLIVSRPVSSPATALAKTASLQTTGVFMGFAVPALTLGGVRFATSKSGGSCRQRGKASRMRGRRLGIKKLGGHFVRPGQILMRQSGLKFKCGIGVGMGKDHTIYAKAWGRVKYTKYARPWKSSLSQRWRKFIHVHPADTSGEEVFEWTRRMEAGYLEACHLKKHKMKRMSKDRMLRMIATQRFHEKKCTGKVDDYPGGWKELLREAPVYLPDKMPIIGQRYTQPEIKAPNVRTY